MLIAALVLAQAAAVSDTPEIPMVGPYENLCTSPSGRIQITIPGIPPSDSLTDEERAALITQQIAGAVEEALPRAPKPPVPVARFDEPIYVPGSDPNLAYRHPLSVAIPHAMVVVDEKTGEHKLSCVDPSVPLIRPAEAE